MDGLLSTGPTRLVYQVIDLTIALKKVFNHTFDLTIALTNLLKNNWLDSCIEENVWSHNWLDSCLDNFFGKKIDLTMALTLKYLSRPCLVLSELQNWAVQQQSMLHVCGSLRPSCCLHYTAPSLGLTKLAAPHSLPRSHCSPNWFPPRTGSLASTVSTSARTDTS